MTIGDGGYTYPPPEGEKLDRRLAGADRPGEHLWCVSALWRVRDPAARGDDPMLLDRENMLVFTGTGCYKCEQTYSDDLAAQPCTGSIE